MKVKNYLILVIIVAITMMFGGCVISDGGTDTTNKKHNGATDSPEPQGAKKGSRSNPYTAGETATYDGKDSYFYTFKAELTLVDFIRGEEAWDIVKEGSMYNTEPSEGKEYILVKFKVTVLETKDDEKADINDFMFDYVSKSGIEYTDYASVAGVTPAFSPMYAGAELEGYSYEIINLSDEPMISFQGIWFSIA